MTFRAIFQALKSLQPGLTRAALAADLNVSEETVKKWCGGQVLPGKASRPKILGHLEKIGCQQAKKIVSALGDASVSDKHGRRLFENDVSEEEAEALILSPEDARRARIRREAQLERDYLDDKRLADQRKSRLASEHMDRLIRQLARETPEERAIRVAAQQAEAHEERCQRITNAAPRICLRCKNEFRPTFPDNEYCSDACHFARSPGSTLVVLAAPCA